MKSQTEYQFVPPETAEAAEERRLQLIQEAEEIQQQIQFTNLEEYGDEEAYKRWRRAAHLAMMRKRQEARWLRTWKARLLSSVPWSRSGDDDFRFANALLQEVYKHYTQLGRISAHEEQLMNKIKKHLKRCAEDVPGA